MILGSATATKRMAKELGIFLKQKREAVKVSQGAVARRLGYSSAQFVSNIERGLCFPPMDALKMMMELYKISGTEMTKILFDLQSSYFKEEFSSLSPSRQASKTKRA